MAEPMSLESVLLDEKPKVDAPVAVPDIPAFVPEVGAPEVKLEGTPVSSTRRKHREKEEAAKAEGSGQVRDPETGKYVEKPKEPEAAAVPEKKEEAATPKPAETQQFTDKEKAFLRAAEEERRKRQDLERQLTELRAKPAAQAAAEPAKGFFDDPEAALASFEQRTQTVILKSKLDITEAIARNKYPDFEAKFATFRDLANTTPGLANQWLTSSDPAEFAYKTGRDYMALKQAGDLPKMKEQLEKELRLKIEAEHKEKADAEAKKREAIPGSLSSVTGSNPTKPVWGGPPSLDDILKL